MNKHKGLLYSAIAFVVALLAGVIVGSLIQTHLNMEALRQLGVEVSPGLQIQSSLHDLVNFAPLYAAIFGASFLVSQTIAMLVTRRVLTRWRAPVCALAAASGLWLAFLLVNALAPMPTLIAASRGIGGTLLLVAVAGFSGWLFAWLNGQKQRSGSTSPVMVLLLAGGLLLPAQDALAQSATSYRVDTVVDGLEHPWSLAFLPDGRMLVTERPGRLRLVTMETATKGELVADPVSGVPAVFASGQAGLFDVVLAPDFEDSQILYLSYACGTARANHTCLAKGRLVDGALEQVVEVFRVQPAKTGNAHYGGRVAWLADGTLVLGLGDGFDYREESQNTGSHIGSVVRLNPDGSVPEDNPFVGQSGVRPELYSYGHRNIQGLVYDESHDRLISHEHGPKGGDEINIIEPGKNYGWPVTTHGVDYTGARITPFTEQEGMEPPRLQWTPSIAPSGLALYTGDLFPQWQGDLLVGALASRRVHRVSLDQDGSGAKDVEILFEELGERIRDVRMGPEGALYLLTDSPEGRILRVTPQ